MTKRTYDRHLRKAASRKWPNNPIFDDFKVVKIPDGVRLQCWHPNCHRPKTVEEWNDTTLPPSRPTVAFDSLKEARSWCRSHIAAHHRTVDDSVVPPS